MITAILVILDLKFNKLLPVWELEYEKKTEFGDADGSAQRDGDLWLKSHELVELLLFEGVKKLRLLMVMLLKLWTTLG